MDAHLVSLAHHAALLVRVEQRGDGGHIEAGGNSMPAQDVEDARHAPAVAVLALRQLADRVAAVAQLIGLVVGVEGEGDRATRSILPRRGFQHSPGPHMIDDAAPAWLGPLPGLHLGGAAHFLRPSIRRAIAWAATASLATKRAKSSGDDPTARRPNASNSFWTSGSCSVRAISLGSRATISGGAPAGSQAPNQLTTRKSLKPCSCMVGTSGMPFQRSLPVTASARSLPSCTSGSAIWVPMKNMSMWPPMRSVMAAGVPL